MAVSLLAVVLMMARVDALWRLVATQAGGDECIYDAEWLPQYLSRARAPWYQCYRLFLTALPECC